MLFIYKSHLVCSSLSARPIMERAYPETTEICDKANRATQCTDLYET